MAGTVIYAVDPQTQEFLAELIETMTSLVGQAPVGDQACGTASRIAPP
jgi:hypothetical protein